MGWVSLNLILTAQTPYPTPLLEQDFLCAPLGNGYPTQSNLKRKKKKFLKDKVKPWLLPLTFTSTYTCEVTIVPKVCNGWESDLMKVNWQ